MEYAHKVSKLVKGKTYLVAHAQIVSSFKTIWANVPIIPILHKDEKFAPHIGEHYHLDMRFSTPPYVKHKFVIDKSQSNVPVLKNDIYGFYIAEIIFLEKKCLRLNTSLKIPQTKSADRYHEWYKSMIGKSCAGKRCPHYGATMIEDNGKIYCPMHNLHADPLTLKVVAPY